MAQKEFTIVNIRIDPATLKRIDRHAKKMQETIPYFSRNQMLNLLLIKGLDIHEKGESSNGIHKDTQQVN